MSPVFTYVLSVSNTLSIPCATKRPSCCCTKRPFQSSTEQPGWLSDSKSCVGCLSPRRHVVLWYHSNVCDDNQSQTGRRRRKSGCMRFTIVQCKPSMFSIYILAYPVHIPALNCCFTCTFLILPAPMSFRKAVYLKKPCLCLHTVRNLV